MKKIILTYLFFLTWIISQGQDPQFTQFYANPLYLNPAFAGTSIQSRLVVATRIQWASIPGAFQTYSASFAQLALPNLLKSTLVMLHRRAISIP